MGFTIADLSGGVGGSGGNTGGKAIEIQTNTPTQVNSHIVSFMIPDGKSCRILVSTDGVIWEDPFGWMYGQQMCRVKGTQPKMWVNVDSNESFNVTIIG